MNIFSFAVHFTDEESYILHFKEQRDEQGVTCNRCGGQSHYWLKSKWAYQCRPREARQTLRSGTIMKNSSLPFLIWYKTLPRKVFLARRSSQHQLGFKRYEPVWAMVHKLRDAMGQRR